MNESREKDHRVLYTAVIASMLLTVVGLSGCSRKQEPAAKEASAPAPAVSIPVARLETLTSVELQPSDKPQTCRWEDRLFVTVPGNTLTNSGKLVISSVSGLRNPELPVKSRMLAMYDVSLGDIHGFDEPIAVEFSYASAAPTNEDSLLAFSWDKSSGQWVAEPSYVDKEKKRLVVLANHLSTFAYAEVQTDGHAANEYFSMRWDAGEVRNRIAAGSLRKESVEQAWNALNESRQKYLSANFSDLPYFEWQMKRRTSQRSVGREGGFPGGEVEITILHNAFIADSSAGAYRNKLGTITISYDVIQAPKDYLELQIAHEVFHSVQNTYYSFAGMTDFGTPFTGKPEWQITARSWWMDATADYAAYTIVAVNKGEPSRDMGIFIDQKYLEKSIMYGPSSWYGLLANDAHEYHNYNTAWLIHYLVKNVGVNFRNMFVEISQMANPSIAFNLDAYLAQNHRTTLAEAYKGFVQWWLFDSKSPLRGKSAQVPQGSVGQNLLFPLATKKYPMPVSVDGNYAAKVCKVTVETSKDVPLRTLGVKVSDKKEDLSRDVTVLAFLMKGDLIANKGQCMVLLDPLMLFGGAGGDLPEKLVELKNGDALYILVINAGSSATVNIDVRSAEVLVGIGPASVKDGEPNNEYQFAGLGREIPQAVKRVKCQWFCDGLMFREERANVQNGSLNVPMTAEFSVGDHKLGFVLVDDTNGDAEAKKLGECEIPVQISEPKDKKLRWVLVRTEDAGPVTGGARPLSAKVAGNTIEIAEQWNATINMYWPPQTILYGCISNIGFGFSRNKLPGNSEKWRISFSKTNNLVYGMGPRWDKADYFMMTAKPSWRTAKEGNKTIGRLTMLYDYGYTDKVTWSTDDALPNSFTRTYTFELGSGGSGKPPAAVTDKTVK